VDPIPSIWRKPSDEGVAFGQARTLHGALHMRWENHGWRHRRKAFADGSSGGC